MIVLQMCKYCTELIRREVLYFVDNYDIITRTTRVGSFDCDVIPINLPQ